MPRDGSNIYAIPLGTEGVPNTTIESAKYNAFAHDVETDLNTPRPIIAGGTGANNAVTARANLQAERSMQVITNFDSAVWEVGSFYAAVGATNAPVAGHAFAGIVYGPDASNLVVEARDLSDTATPGIVYVREKTAGVWAVTWTADSSNKVNVAGDTMTGNLTITKSAPAVILNRTDTAGAGVTGQKGGLNRWTINLGAADPESTGNVGSGFYITRYNDAGAAPGDVLNIDRATGVLTHYGDVAITKPFPQLNLNYDASGTGACIVANRGALQRWRLYIGNGGETGSGNSGSDIYLQNFNDAGTLISNAVNVNRASGLITVVANPTAALGVATKQYVDASGFPAGTNMLFVQAVAPTGWTKSVTHNDKALRIVSSAGGGSGGVNGFAGTFSYRTADYYTLTLADIPAHSHQFLMTVGGGAQYGAYQYYAACNYVTVNDVGNPYIYNAGSSNQHTHTYDMRVQYVDALICVKN